MKEKIVATHESTMRAVDFTPIYFFRACRTIKPGSLIRWDAAEKKLVIEHDTETEQKGD